MTKRIIGTDAEDMLEILDRSLSARPQAGRTGRVAGHGLTHRVGLGLHRRPARKRRRHDDTPSARPVLDRRLTQRSPPGRHPLRGATSQPCVRVASHGALAQLGERQLCKLEAIGSIPIRSISRTGCKSVVFSSGYSTGNPSVGCQWAQNGHNGSRLRTNWPEQRHLPTPIQNCSHKGGRVRDVAAVARPTTCPFENPLGLPGFQPAGRHEHRLGAVRHDAVEPLILRLCSNATTRSCSRPRT